jgi:hypothetical protein
MPTDESLAQAHGAGRPPLRACRWQGAAILAGLWWMPAAAVAAPVPPAALPGAVARAEPRDPDSPSWLTGAALERHLETPVGLLRWSSNPLRDALRSLSVTQRVAVFPDRRVDPDQLVDFASQGEPLADLIARLAAELGLGTCRIGPVIYLGPRPTAAVLPTVVEIHREQLQRTAAASDSRLRQARTMAWPELSTPREQIAQLAQEAGLVVEDLDLIPHDLWPAVDLPPLGFIERMSLLLAGFEKTFQFEGEARIRLVALPARAQLQRDHPMSARAAERIEALVRQEFPDADVVRRPAGLAVQGPIEVHRAIERWLRGQVAKPARAPAVTTELRYTLEIKNQPVEAIARALAERLDLELRYAPQLQDRLQQRVSFRVDQVTRDQLLQALFAPAGLSFQIAGSTLTILPDQRD